MKRESLFIRHHIYSTYKLIGKKFFNLKVEMQSLYLKLIRKETQKKYEAFNELHSIVIYFELQFHPLLQPVQFTVLAQFFWNLHRNSVIKRLRIPLWLWKQSRGLHPATQQCLSFSTHEIWKKAIPLYFILWKQMVQPVK